MLHDRSAERNRCSFEFNAGLFEGLLRALFTFKLCG